jgi:hypothetical protein
VHALRLYLRQLSPSHSASLLPPQPAANAPHRVDEFLLEVLINLMTQIFDVNVHDIRDRVEGKLPDMLDNHGARHTPSCITHEKFEQGKLAWRQVKAVARLTTLSARSNSKSSTRRTISTR